MKSRITTGLLLLLSGLTPLSAVPAGVLPSKLETLYYDDFSGSGSAALNGTTPDITLGANTWTANSNIKANGAVGSPTLGDGESAVLPFTPSAGHRYVLEATFSITQSNPNSNDWLGYGFTQSGSIVANGGQNLNFNGAPWMLQVGPDGSPVANVVAPFGGVGTSNQIGSFPGVNGTNRFELLLDTTGAQWTAEFFTNGLSYATFTYSSVPTINFIAITRDGAGELVGSLDQFQLSEEVPEPAAAVLCGVGAALLWWQRRRA